MLTWLINNIGTVVAILGIIAVVCVAVAILIKDKKKGRSSCGCNCAHCNMAGSCHKLK